MVEEFEVTQKYDVTDYSDKVKRFFYDAFHINETKENDSYYDTEDRSLFKDGILIRLRNNSRIEFKVAEKDKLAGLESSFSIPLKEEKLDSFNKTVSKLNLRNVKKADHFSFFFNNLLREFVVLRKTRKIYKKHDYVFEFDHIENLGYFLDVKKRVEDQQLIDHTVFEINKMMNNFRASPLDVGYVEVYLRKYNYELYKQGHFLMKEDLVTSPELRKELPRFEQVMEDLPQELTIATPEKDASLEKIEVVSAPVSSVSREDEILEELLSKPEVQEMLNQGLLTRADLVEEAKQAAANERFFS